MHVLPTIVTLRAGWADKAKAGDWFAAATGRAVFRVLSVEGSHIVCARYAKAELPAGVQLRRWPEASPCRPLTHRMRRQDHLQRLLRSGVISERQFAAAVRFRDTLERAEPALPVSCPTLSMRRTPCGVDQVHDTHLLARRSVERALTALGADGAAVVQAVVVNNGSLAGFASRAHIRESSAASRLSVALSSLDAWYNQPVVGRGRHMRSLTAGGV